NPQKIPCAVRRFLSLAPDTPQPAPRPGEGLRPYSELTIQRLRRLAPASARATRRMLALAGCQRSSQGRASAQGRLRRTRVRATGLTVPLWAPNRRARA